MADQRDADRTEELVDERIAIGAVAAVVGRVVELDRDDRRQRHRIAEHEVHVLGADAVEGSLIHLTVRDLAEIVEPDLEQDHEASADRLLQHVVERELGWGEHRLARRVGKCDRELLRGRAQRDDLPVHAPAREEDREAAAPILGHGRARLGPGGSCLKQYERSRTPKSRGIRVPDA